MTWREVVRSQPIDAAWMRWWRESWHVKPTEMAAKAHVTRMTIYRWEHGKSEIPRRIIAWVLENLPNEPRLPYPGVPEITEYEPSTEEEQRELYELSLAYWRKPRKRMVRGGDETC